MHDFLLFLAGIITGAMNGIAGGGLLIGFPAMLSYGLPALVANATGNLVVLPGQLASAIGYWKYVRQTPLKYAWLLVPWVAGAIAGSLLLRRTTSNDFEHFVPGLIAFAVLLFAFQPFLHHHLHKHIHSRSKRVRPLIVIGLCLLPVAVYGGYFGAGVGFIMLAFLGFTKIHDAHQMNGLKNVAATVSCLACIIILAPGSFINWHAGLVMGAGSLIGGYTGARIALRVSSHAIRIFVVVIGVITATYLALRQY